MTEDLQSRLQEASTLFNAQKYPECAAVLSSCPQDDPKVQHNLALVQYLLHGGNYLDVLTKLSTDGKESVFSSTMDPQHFALHYEGQENAIYNQAVIALHNGAADRALDILCVLASQSDKFSPKLALRMVILMQLTSSMLSRRGKKHHRRSAQVEEMVNAAFSDKGNKELLNRDAAINRFSQLALADTGLLHNWFGKSPKLPVDQVIYLNNLGAEALNGGKGNAAATFFAKAAAIAIANKESTCKFVMQSVLYNNGLCAILRQQPDAALRAFLQTQETMKGSPTLWLRIAQSAIMALTEALTQEQCSMAAAAQQAAVKAIEENGMSGRQAHINLLPSRPSGIPLANATDRTLELVRFASVALSNVFLLCDEPNPTPTMRTTMHYALCSAAYLEVLRCNYALTVKHVTHLLSLSNSAAVNKDIIIASLCYAAEALCAINKPREALRILQQVSLGELLASDPEAPMSGTTRKANIEALFVNLCTAHILSASWHQANQIAYNVLGKMSQPTSKHAVLMQTYLELAQGNRDKALELLVANPFALAPPFAL